MTMTVGQLFGAGFFLGLGYFASKFFAALVKAIFLVITDRAR